MLGLLSGRCCAEEGVLGEGVSDERRNGEVGLPRRGTTDHQIIGRSNNTYARHVSTYSPRYR